MLGGCLGGEESAVDRRRSRFECAGSHRCARVGRPRDGCLLRVHGPVGCRRRRLGQGRPGSDLVRVAQDLTERWVHQMQIREAVDRVENYPARYLTVVLRTFVWAFPYQYRVDAPAGTLVQIDLGTGGAWRLTCDGTTQWSLEEGSVQAPDAHAVFTDDAGWRLLTGAAVPADGMRLEGARELCQPLLDVRAILV